MTSIWKSGIWRMTVTCYVLALALILSSCSSGSAAAPTPTPAPAAKLYKGTYFTMQYPGDWHQQADGDQATFASAASRDVLAVFTDPNDVGNTATTIANNAMSDFMKTVLSSAQAAQVAPTIQLDGANWVQLSATGMLTSDPGVEGNFYLLVTNYPSTGPNVIAYEIEYYGPASTFNVGNVDFQAMLQSFQFVVPVKTATPGT